MGIQFHLQETNGLQLYYKTNVLFPLTNPSLKQESFLHVRLAWFPQHMDWERRKVYMYLVCETRANANISVARSFAQCASLV